MHSTVKSMLSLSFRLSFKIVINDIRSEMQQYTIVTSSGFNVSLFKIRSLLYLARTMTDVSMNISILQHLLASFNTPFKNTITIIITVTIVISTPRTCNVIRYANLSIEA